MGTGHWWRSPVPHTCPCACPAPAPLERCESPRTPSCPTSSSWWQFCCSRPFPLNPDNKNPPTPFNQPPRTPLQLQPQAVTTGTSHSAAAQKGASNNISIPVLLCIISSTFLTLCQSFAHSREWNRGHPPGTSGETAATPTQGEATLQTLHLQLYPAVPAKSQPCSGREAGVIHPHTHTHAGDKRNVGVFSTLRGLERLPRAFGEGPRQSMRCEG